MSKMYFVLGGWLALNFALPLVLLNRRSRPHLRHRLFRWALGSSWPVRKRYFAHSQVSARLHHR
jgi:hypothetical protein